MLLNVRSGIIIKYLSIVFLTICFVCAKETSLPNATLTQQKLGFDKKNDSSYLRGYVF